MFGTHSTRRSVDPTADLDVVVKIKFSVVSERLLVFVHPIGSVLTDSYPQYSRPVIVRLLYLAAHRSCIYIYIYNVYKPLGPTVVETKPLAFQEVYFYRYVFWFCQHFKAVEYSCWI